ncbi:MAG: hypothetical protein ACREXY_25360, partial [Gammaproteobacteria bacterium]
MNALRDAGFRTYACSMGGPDNVYQKPSVSMFFQGRENYSQQFERLDRYSTEHGLLATTEYVLISLPLRNAASGLPASY